MIKTITLKTPLGNIKGKVEDKCQKFLGIPYAEKPVDDLQFKYPVSVKPWEGELDATKLKKNPIQYPMKDNCSEDCLYLNIYAPREALGGKLPVVVWIYGGSYVHGGCAGSLKHGKNGTYDGEIFATENKCILVTINYRLGVYGFLYLSHLDSSFEPNVGLRDCEEALRWVQNYIQYFGGDADNVTLWGQSAGGALIMALMTIDSAKHLFHRAIVESACMESFYSVEQAKEITKIAFDYWGLKDDEVDKLRTMPYKKVVSVIKTLDKYIRSRIFGICSLNPVIDGNYLKEFPSKSSFDNGRAKPLLIGANKNEAYVFRMIMGGLSGSDVLGRIMVNFDKDYARRVITKYSENPQTEDYCQLAGDIMYHITRDRAAKTISQYAHVYVYRFDYAPWLLRKLKFGACHVAEMPLVFGNLRPLYGLPLFKGDSGAAEKIGTRMRRRWGAFARNTNPNLNEEGTVVWQPYTDSQRNYMIFDKEDRVVVGLDDEMETRLEGKVNFFNV